MYFLNEPETRLASLIQADMHQCRIVFPKPRNRQSLVLNVARQLRQRRANARISRAETGKLRRLFAAAGVTMYQSGGKRRRTLLRRG